MNNNTQLNVGAARCVRTNSIRCLSGLLGAVLLGVSLSDASAEDKFFDSASSGSVWDATTTTNWSLLSAGTYDQFWGNAATGATNVARFEGTPGTVNVSAVDSPTCMEIQFNAANGYILAGGTILLTTNTATNSAGDYLPTTIFNNVNGFTNTITSVIADAPGHTPTVQFRGGNFSTVMETTGANTFAGELRLRSCRFIFDNLQNGGIPSPLGQGTSVVVCVNASAVNFVYNGPGNQSSDRAFTVGGTGGANIENRGFGPISFDYEGDVTSGAFGRRTLSLGGDFTAEPSYFRGTITDMPGFASTLSHKGAFWIVTGVSSHSTNTLESSGGTLGITNESGLGAANSVILFTQSGTLASVSNDVTLSATHTITVASTRLAGFKPLDTNNMYVEAFITGVGGVKKQNSSFLLGTVRFSNDANNYTGNFEASFGNTEFTSVANAGVPSSLGAGTTIRIVNSASAGTLRYVGATASSTTRPLDWANNTGGYRLDASGAGTIAFLATGTLKSAGGGDTTLFLQGSNTGTNTLAQEINDFGGATALNKQDAGTWILSGANTYTGDTTISGGTLALAGSGTIGSSTNLVIDGDGTFDVSALGGGYTLTAGTTLWATNGATASVSGNLNVAAATVHLGYSNGFPAITVTGGSLTLGASTPFQVDINNGGVPLGAGSYKLISAGGGSVAGTAPSSVSIGGDGLSDTATLNITGGELYLNVGAATPATPVINGIVKSGSDLVMTFTGTNGTYCVLSSTNVTTPMALWVTNSTGSFGPSGTTVNWTNSAATKAQEFFRIKVQ